MGKKIFLILASALAILLVVQTISAIVINTNVDLTTSGLNQESPETFFVSPTGEINSKIIHITGPQLKDPIKMRWENTPDFPSDSQIDFRPTVEIIPCFKNEYTFIEQCLPQPIKAQLFEEDEKPTATISLEDLDLKWGDLWDKMANENIIFKPTLFLGIDSTGIPATQAVIEQKKVEPPATQPSTVLVNRAEPLPKITLQWSFEDWKQVFGLLSPEYVEITACAKEKESQAETCNPPIPPVSVNKANGKITATVDLEEITTLRDLEEKNYELNIKFVSPDGTKNEVTSVRVYLAPENILAALAMLNKKMLSDLGLKEEKLEAKEAPVGDSTASVGTDLRLKDGEPSLSVETINRILKNTPMKEKGQLIFDLSKQYDIDSAFALAFFRQESNFGASRIAAANYNPGNLRVPGKTEFQNFATWGAGIEAWFKLIANGSRYYQAENYTLEEIVPFYAPAGDGDNNPDKYIANVKAFVSEYRDSG